MRTVLVTGASGFIGKNLCARLERIEDIEIIRYTRDNSLGELDHFVTAADFIFHIAGVNRPTNDNEFTINNQNLTEQIVQTLQKNHKQTPMLLTSSSQAASDNAYGVSKLAAETAALSLRKESHHPVYIYRLPGVFGKWSKPNYNSVVATFCYNIANDLPVQISDPDHHIDLVYIDEVIDEFITTLDGKTPVASDGYYRIPRTFTVSLGDLAYRINNLHTSRTTLIMPNLEDDLNKYLYATYISYLDQSAFAYELTANTDDRGWLAEFIKSKQFGQIFISKTKPGITRGDHWHSTKIEKFLVVQGHGEILFRNKIADQDIISYKVDGDKPTVLDIPTGYVHSITNIGSQDLITIFWANEILDKERPDTYYEKV